jgi:hypothetical protein
MEGIVDAEVIERNCRRAAERDSIEVPLSRQPRQAEHVLSPIERFLLFMPRRAS